VEAGAHEKVLQCVCVIRGLACGVSDVGSPGLGVCVSVAVSVASPAGCEWEIFLFTRWEVDLYGFLLMLMRHVQDCCVALDSYFSLHSSHE